MLSEFRLKCLLSLKFMYVRSLDQVIDKVPNFLLFRIKGRARRRTIGKVGIIEDLFDGWASSWIDRETACDKCHSLA